MRKLMLTGVVVLVGLYLLARFVPVEPVDRRPGLGLTGPVADARATDWTFLQGLTEIEVETRGTLGIPHSVTTVLWRAGDHLYIPCKACDTKRWPGNVAADPQVRIRVRGIVYPMRMQRVADPAERDELLGAAFPQVTPDVWVFRLTPG